jgi:cysteine desulfuration protein SufE
LLCEVYTDSDPAEAVAVEPKIWEACGFTKMLSPTRLNGLANMRKRIREMAEGFAQ